MKTQLVIPQIAETWPTLFTELLGRHTLTDAAHDPNHVLRVVTNARRLTSAEGADWRVVMPAAWLHDCVAVPKSSPDRRNASRLLRPPSRRVAGSACLAAWALG